MLKENLRKTEVMSSAVGGDFISYDSYLQFFSWSAFETHVLIFHHLCFGVRL